MDQQLVEENQPGMLRRIVMFPITLMIIEIAVLMVGATLIARPFEFLKTAMSPDHFDAVFGLAIGLGAVALYYACQHWIERNDEASRALKGAGLELGQGLLFGFLLFSAVTGVVALLGGIQFEGVRGWGRFWWMLGLALYSGPFEEVLFRGIVFRQLERLTGTWLALALSSAIFGFLHMLNPNASFFAGLAISLEAGIMLGAAYLLTRRLWLAIGIHSAWNFTQGWVFSIPVSGTEPPLGLLKTRVVGSEWLTGGDFGLEASVVALVLATLAGLIMLRRAVLRDGVRPPMWVKRVGAIQTNE